MASIISAGTTSGTALNMAGDTSGVLQLATNGSTTALTIDTSQNVGIGTTSIAEKLDVNGNIYLRPASPIVYTGGTLTFQSGSASPLIFNTDAGLERMRLDSDGNLLFNSGYGSVATAYGCRAWVNFDGTSNATNLTGTYSQTGTTVTVTITGHGYITGNSAFLDFTSGTAVDGDYTVTVTDANTFTVTQASRTTSGNVTDRRSNIRASGNVSSISDNGTGDYTVNFTNNMPDANYAVLNLGQRALGSNNYGLVSSYSSTTTSVSVGTAGATGTVLDWPAVTVGIFR
jgi:hypothetical protein